MTLYAVSPGGIAQAADLNQYRTLFLGGSVFDAVNGYGAVGDNATDNSASIQDAIDDCNAAGGGVVVVSQPGMYRCNVALKTGVTLRGPGEVQGYGAGAIRIATLAQANAGAVITASNVTNAAITSLNVSGGGASNAGAGISLVSSSRVVVKNVNIDNCADSAISMDAGCLANVLEDILTTNGVLNRSRSSVVGAIDIAGADHFLHRVEANASLSGLNSSSFYIPAFAIRGANHFISSCVGEFSDVGWYNLSGYSRFVACRGDLNWGHGFYLAASGQFMNCTALNNSQDANNIYDGFYIAAGTAQGTLLTGCSAVSNSGPVHRYGLNDLAQYSAVESRSTITGFTSAGHGTAWAKNADSLWSGFTMADHQVTIPDGTATPDVSQATIINVAYSTPTNVTNFLNGVNGQTILCFASANTTFKNGTTIKTTTGLDVVGTSQNTPFRFTKYGGAWFQNG